MGWPQTVPHTGIEVGVLTIWDLYTCFLPRLLLSLAAWALLPSWPGELLGTCRSKRLFRFSLWQL